MFSKYLDPKNDLAFKRIFGQEKHKNIPMAFLNAVFHLEGDDAIVDLSFLDGVQPPDIEARKESIVDVLVKDQKGSKYIIEMQVAKVKGFEKRAQYYATKTYCTHFKVKNEYVDLQKVVFLAITSYVVFPNKGGYKSDHVILDKESHEHDLKDFYFTFVELPKFEKTLEELETLEDKWYYFFKHAQETQNISAILAENPAIREAYAVLESTHWSEESLLEYDRLVMAAADARGALAAAEDEGFAKGEVKGHAKGKIEGNLEGKIELVRKLLKRGRPIQEIMEDSGLKKEEVEALME